MKVKNLCKFFLLMLLLIYLAFTDPSELISKIDASLTLLFSLALVYKARNNPVVTLMTFFMMYSNYSITVGEYLIGGSLGTPLHAVKTENIYGINIRLLLLLMSVLLLYYKPSKLHLSEFKLIPKQNDLIFYALLTGLTYAFIFGVNRGGDLSGYTVRISPLYEYSTLLFLFAYYFSGPYRHKKIILTVIAVLFIIQDFYFGGRITALQIIFFLLFTIYLNRLSLRSIWVYGILGIVVNGAIAAFRNTRVMNANLLVGTLERLKDSMFVFETPIYAYYASATHIATTEIISNKERLTSLWAFLKAIFLGSDTPIGNVTYYVSQNYFVNVGGGILPSYFYFWMGWGGVVTIAFIIVYMLNIFSLRNNDYSKLCFLTFAITLPRWYIYSPVMIFRPIMFATIMYLLFSFVHKIMSKAEQK